MARDHLNTFEFAISEVALPEEYNGWEGEDPDGLGQLLVFQLDDGNSGHLRVVIDVLKLLNRFPLKLTVLFTTAAVSMLQFGDIPVSNEYVSV